jgi:hypothetical protein
MVPDKNPFAFDFVCNVGDCKFIGERHSFAFDDRCLRMIAIEVEDGSLLGSYLFLSVFGEEFLTKNSERHPSLIRSAKKFTTPAES